MKNAVGPVGRLQSVETFDQLFLIEFTFNGLRLSRLIVQQCYYAAFGATFANRIVIFTHLVDISSRDVIRPFSCLLLGHQAFVIDIPDERRRQHIFNVINIKKLGKLER